MTTSSIISLMESEKDLKNVNEYFQIMAKMLFILENKIVVSFFVVFNISVLIIVKSEPYSYGKVLLNLVPPYFSFLSILEKKSYQKSVNISCTYGTLSFSK